MALLTGAGAYLVQRAAPDRPRELECALTGNVPGICFLVATSRNGVLLYQEGRLTRLLRGNCYGLTCYDGWWYAFQRLGGYGRIVRFRLEGGRAARVRTVLTGLNYGIHQIDFVRGRLLLVDTLKDRLLVYDDAARLQNASWRRWSRQVYPAAIRVQRDYRWDRLGTSRNTDTCWHFNSVFAARAEIYLVAHNRSIVSGRRSQLFVMDSEFTVRDVRDLGAADVHNFWTDGAREMFCSSARGGLRCGQSGVVALGGYLRGLSVAEDFVLVGSSRLAVDRHERDEGDGQIHVLDSGLAAVGQLRIAATQVHEIRRVDAVDLALSAAQPGTAGETAEA